MLKNWKIKLIFVTFVTWLYYGCSCSNLTYPPGARSCAGKVREFFPDKKIEYFYYEGFFVEGVADFDRVILLPSDMSVLDFVEGDFDQTIDRVILTKIKCYDGCFANVYHGMEKEFGTIKKAESQNLVLGDSVDVFLCERGRLSAAIIHLTAQGRIHVVLFLDGDIDWDRLDSYL